MDDKSKSQQGQGPKEGHTDHGQHLGQQKQAAGEIGKDAAHGKSGQSNEVEDEDVDDTTQEAGTGTTGA